AKVKPFVERMGDKMAYRVGLVDQATEAAYMTGANGIPHAFLVDDLGRVVWQGHPLTLDEPLDSVLAGTFDLEKAVKVDKAVKELASYIQPDKPDFENALLKSEEILALDPINDTAIGVRYAIGSATKKPPLVRETLTRIPIEKLPGQQANS